MTPASVLVYQCKLNHRTPSGFTLFPLEVFMPLINPQEMTEANLTVKRSDGSISPGPVTPKGNAHSAATNLRPDFTSRLSQNGELAHKDVKNEGRSDYVHENTVNMDKMSCDETGFLHENASIAP